LPFAFVFPLLFTLYFCLCFSFAFDFEGKFCPLLCTVKSKGSKGKKQLLLLPPPLASASLRAEGAEEAKDKVTFCPLLCTVKSKGSKGSISCEQNTKKQKSGKCL
jgi:hypothetical protein